MVFIWLFQATLGIYTISQNFESTLSFLQFYTFHESMRLIESLLVRIKSLNDPLICTRVPLNLCRMQRFWGKHYLISSDQMIKKPKSCNSIPSIRLLEYLLVCVNSLNDLHSCSIESMQHATILRENTIPYHLIIWSKRQKAVSLDDKLWEFA